MSIGAVQTGVSGGAASLAPVARCAVPAFHEHLHPGGLPSRGLDDRRAGDGLEPPTFAMHLRAVNLAERRAEARAEAGQVMPAAAGADPVRASRRDVCACGGAAAEVPVIAPAIRSNHPVVSLEGAYPVRMTAWWETPARRGGVLDVLG